MDEVCQPNPLKNLQPLGLSVCGDAREATINLAAALSGKIVQQDVGGGSDGVKIIAGGSCHMAQEPSDGAKVFIQVCIGLLEDVA